MIWSVLSIVLHSGVQRGLRQRKMRGTGEVFVLGGI